MAAPAFIAVSYSYRAEGIPFDAHPSRRRVDRLHVRALVDVPIPQIEGSEAPVVVSLASGNRWLDVRRRGDMFLRPVLDPNGSMPVTLDRLHELARGQVEWPDNPLETALDADAIDLDEAAWRGLRSRDRLNDAFVLAKAANLLLVDGVLHRPCHVPTLKVRSVREPRETPRHGYRLGWEIADTDDGPYDRLGDDASGDRSYHDWHDANRRPGTHHWGDFPMDRREAAAAFMGELGRITGRFARVPEDVIVTRPDLLPASTPAPATEPLTLVTETLEDLGGPFNEWTLPYMLDRIPKPIGLALIEVQELVDAADGEAALEALWNVMDSASESGAAMAVAFPRSGALARVVRHQAYDRHLHLSDDDALALADLPEGGPSTRL